MMNTITLETYEQLTHEPVVRENMPATVERRLPAVPFPKKYVLSVFLDLSSALQAAYALNNAGFQKQEIHLLQSHECVTTLGQDQSPLNIITSMDYDIYLREAYRGRFFLAVRPERYGQLHQIRDVLAPHGAYLANYIDTWTITELLK